MDYILNSFRSHAIKLSIICPIVSILIFSGAITFIPNPTSDWDFFYLLAAIATIGVLSLLGLISAKMYFTEYK